MVMHVGPIWGQYEAEEKVNAFMAKNEMFDWSWTGSWYSENLTSYAEFQKRGKIPSESEGRIIAAEKYLNRADFHKQLRNEFMTYLF